MKLLRYIKLLFVHFFFSEKVFLRRTIFYVNVFLMSVISISFLFPERFDFVGYSLDSSYDRLTENNYRWAILEGNDAKSFSSDIRLIEFDETYYRESYTLGYWTPRSAVADTLISAVRRGASVVIFDFVFRRPAPVILKNGSQFDDDAAFLERFRTAAEEAKKRRSIIIIPYPNTPEMNRLAEEYPDSVAFANFGVWERNDDRVVRRARWLASDSGHLSVALLAFLHSSFPPDKRAGAERDIRRALTREDFVPEVIPESLADLLSGSSLHSSRIVYRYLLPENIRALDKKARVAQLGVLYRPDQINSTYDFPDLSGRIVLMGSTFTELGDVHKTPVGSVSGVVILANVVNMVLNGQFSHGHFLIDILIVLAAIMIFSFIFAYMPYTINLVITIVIAYSVQYISMRIYNLSFFYCNVGFAIVLAGILNCIYGIINRAAAVIRYVRSSDKK